MLQCQVRYWVSAALGLLCLGLALAALLELHRYMPIYEEVYCKPARTSLGSVSLTPFSATITVDIDCINPNPYEISVLPTKAGRVYLGLARQDVGRFTLERAVVPAAGDEAPGTAIIPAHADISLGFFETVSIGSSILNGPFAILFDLNLKVLIQPTLMLSSPATIDIAVSEKCGMYIQVVPSQDSGDCVCSGDGFEKLQVPAIDAPSKDDRGFTPEVSEETISNAEGARDGFCGALMALGGSCGLVLLTLPAACLLRQVMASPRTKAGAAGGRGEVITIGAAAVD